MGKRSREKRLSRTTAREATPSAAAKTVSPRAPQPRLSGWRRLVLQLLLAVVIPAMLLGMTEIALRLCHYGYSTRFFEKRDDGQSLDTNPQFGLQYYSRETATSPTPLIIPLRKAPGTRRIVVLGESAAAGTPDPAFGFARILEFMLREQYPSNRFEMVNAAMRGIDSHIVLSIARECAELSPDLFIVYLGNNELIGLHSPSPEEINFTPPLWLLRLGHNIKAARLAQLTRAALRRLGPKSESKKQDMEFLRRQRLAFDDPRRAAVYKNFQANLADICDIIRRSGAQAIIASVEVNLHDFPPLGSLHRHDLTSAQQAEWEKVYSAGAAAESRSQMEEALTNYQAAAWMDDHFAELHFRLARCYETAGKVDLAQRHYSLARDWDALQFRADSRIDDIAQQLATNRQAQGIHFADVKKAFAESPLAEHGVPGKRLFQDHVHLTFDGDYRLAQSLLPTAIEGLQLRSGAGSAPSREDCARALAFTPVDDMNVRAAMVRQTANPPFLDQLDHAQRQAEAEREAQERLTRTTPQDFERAAAVYRGAIARNPDDWMLHYNFGNLLSQFGQHAAAVTEYEFVVKRLPRQRALRMSLANTLLQAGRAVDAITQFHAALQIDPDYKPARDAIAAIQQRLR